MKFAHNSPNSWQLDTVVATVVLLIAIVLFPLRFFVSQILVETIPIVLGVASIVFLAVKYYGHSETTSTNWQFSVRTTNVLRAGTILGLGGLVSVGILTGARTIQFFLVASAVGTLLFVRILFARESALKPGFLIGELIVFGVILRGTALATTPGLIGVDTWTHVTDYAGAIQQTGSLSAIADTQYFAAPLYHLLVVVTADLFNTSLRTALYLLFGIILPVSTILVYSTSRYFLPVRWSLFAVAVYSISDHVVRWGIEIIPTSMGVVFFLAIFYGVTKIYVSQNRWPLYALVLFFGVATVLTHQISAFVTLVFLGVGAGIQLVYRVFVPTQGPRHQSTAHRQVNFVGLFVFTLIVTVIDWMLTPLPGGNFITRMVDLLTRQVGASAGFLNIASDVTITNAVIQGLITTTPTWVGLVDSLGLLLLLLVTLIGSFTLLRQTRLEALQLTWILAAGVMLFVALGTPMLGIYTFVPNRWFAFLYVPMAVTAAFGVRFLLTRYPSRAIVVGLLVFAIVFPGGMLVADKATPENPVFDDYYPRYSYTESELVAAETVSRIHPDGESIQTDHPYWTIYDRWLQDSQVTQFELTDDGTVSADAAVYRRYQTDGSPRAMYDGKLLSVKLPYRSVCAPSADTVYTSGTVQYCRLP